MKRTFVKLALLVVFVASVAVGSAQAQSPLKAGDRLVFLGDSITEQRIHSRYVMNYFTLRYPGLDVSFRNAGWSGDTAPGGLGRVQRDVLSLKPAVVTICFGMNDGGYSAFDQGRYDNFMRGMTGLVAEFKKANVRVILLGPGCVDNDKRHDPPGVDYNDTLGKYSKGCKDLAEKEKVEYFNLHDLMIDVQAKAKAKDPKYTMIPDSVHPSSPGQLVMAYAMLKALGCKDQASGLEIDAAASKSTPDRCKVDDLKVAENAVTFTRTDDALPTSYDADAASILDFLPFTQDFNQYNFKVTGLKAGKWKLNVEGIDVSTFSEKDLAAGVNLATLSGPWQKLGEQVNQASANQENVYFTYWRQVSLLPVPDDAKPELEALMKKMVVGVDKAEAARLKIVPAERAWKWTLTLVP
jgi:lysophospholipase L1-like esterase